ncbi:MAG: hypothetical protein KDA81_13075 [Planctomycetaceae bacterium]|nr:hypothetical protein [Planctomycetaceae bacterium]
MRAPASDSYASAGLPSATSFRNTNSCNAALLRGTKFDVCTPIYVAKGLAPFNRHAVSEPATVAGQMMQQHAGRLPQERVNLNQHQIH